MPTFLKPGDLTPAIIPDFDTRPSDWSDMGKKCEFGSGNPKFGDAIILKYL